MPTDGPLAACALDVNVEDLRDWLRTLSNTELRRFGRTAQYMCSGKVQPRPGDLPPDHYALHVEEAGAEYRRRLDARKSTMSIKSKQTIKERRQDLIREVFEGTRECQL